MNILAFVLFVLGVVQVHAADVFVDFDPERSIQSAPITVTLTNPSGYDAIRYAIVTSTALPQVALSATVGTQYAGPVAISSHSILMAIGYNTVSGAVTNITTHTYIFPANIIGQANMQSYITSVPRFSNAFAGALQNIPSVSIRSTVAFTALGASELKTSVEYIPNDNSSGWGAYVGVVENTRSTRAYPKKSMDIFGRLAYSEVDRLDYPLFEGFDSGMSSDGVKYNAFQLRSLAQDSIFGSTNGFYATQGIRPVYLKSLWHATIMEDLGLWTNKGRLVHVYWNTEYIGVYLLRPKLSNDVLTQYYGSTNSQYSTVENGTATDGTITKWNSIIAGANAASNRWPSISASIQTKSLMTYMMTYFYTGAVAGGDLTNWVAMGPNAASPFLGPDYGYKFLTSDSDFTFSPNQKNVNLLPGAGTIGGIFAPLSDVLQRHPDFVLAYMDAAWAMLISPNAKLADAAVIGQFNALKALYKLDTTLIPEAARWGNNWAVAPNGQWTPDTWQTDLQSIFDNFVTGRATTVAAQITAINLSPLLRAGPTFNRANGAIVSPGDTLIVTVPSAQSCLVAYTTNGADPRFTDNGLDPGASLSPTAVLTLTLTTSTHVRARCFTSTGGTWGPIDEIYVQVNTTACDLCGKIAITEVYYHPIDAPTNPANLSVFIEFKNAGNTSANMAGAYIDKPFNFKFPPITLAPGAFYVITRSWADFSVLAGKAPNNRYWGRLSRSDDEIKLRDSNGHTVAKVDYDDSVPWPETADGLGYSLVVRNDADALDDNNDARNWRASSAKGGSPGANDPAIPAARNITLTINEIFTFADNSTAEWVELYNPTGTAVNLFRWVFTNKHDGSDNYYRQKNNSYSVPANGYFTLDSNLLDFRFPNSGGSFYAFGVECCDFDAITPLITGEYVQEDFDPSLPNLSLGRHRLSTGAYVFTQLQSPSRTGVNTKPYTAPVIITGVQYIQDPAAVLPGYADKQFIRLQNIVNVDVDLTGWTLGVGKSTKQAPYVFNNVTLKKNQTLYLINATADVAAFQLAYGLKFYEPDAMYIKSFNASTLWDKITLRQAVPGESFTVNVDAVPVDQFAPYPKKRQAMPTNLARNMGTIDYAGDPAAWTVVELTLPPVPVPCNVSDWENGTCSVGCGGGFLNQTRNISVPAQFDGPCDFEFVRTLPCNPQVCPIDCTFSDWTAWATCSKSCGLGSQARTRVVNNSGGFGGKPCVGPQVETQDCNSDGCPVDCVGSWGAWPACDCRTATQTRTFTIRTEAGFGGAPCNHTNGEKETQDCVVQSCNPVDCVGAWTPFGVCDCDTNFHSRTFIVTQVLANGGQDCEFAPEQVDTQECIPTVCPVDCKGAWTIFPACDCSTNTRSRVYKINTQALNGGNECPTFDGDNQTEDCTPLSCDPINCEGSFGDWSDCSCATNTSIRVFTYTVAPSNGGEPCDQEDQFVETEECECKLGGGSSGLPFWVWIVIAVGAVIGLILLCALIYGCWVMNASKAGDWERV